MKLRVLPTLRDLAHAAALDFVQRAEAAIEKHDRFTVALTGGSTPRDAYAMLASNAYASRVNWQRVILFWGDERCVPPDAAASNYRMVKRALLDHVPIPAENIHRMRGEDNPAEAAAAYERLLDEIVGERFDFIHLGMGDDAHIASLFPGSDGLHEQTRRVVAQYAADQKMWRITLTPAAINRADHITFLVAGSRKADAVARVLKGPQDPDANPAQIVAPEDGHVLWLIDADAAHKLRQGS